MAGVALQHTKMEMFEEVRPIMAQQSARSLIPQVQRENIREGARRKDHSRTEEHSGTFSNILEHSGVLEHSRTFWNNLEHSRTNCLRRIFGEALQGRPSRKPFELQERKTAHGSALEGVL